MRNLIILSLILIASTINIYGQGIVKGKKGKPITYAEWSYNRIHETAKGLLADIVKKTERRGCDSLQHFIEKYKLMYDTATTNFSRYRALNRISRTACPEVAQFFEEVIRKDTSVDIRCDAIGFLARISSKESIPFLLKLAKDSSMSRKEKIKIAKTLTILEEYKVSEQLLNDNCYVEDKKLCAECFGGYNIIRNQSSIDFLLFYMQQLDTSFHVGMGWRLVMLGEIKKSYDMAVSYLNHPNENCRASAVRTLIFIDNKKSNKLVENMRKDSSKKVQDAIARDLDRNKKRYIEEVLGKKPKEKNKENVSNVKIFPKTKSSSYNAEAAIDYANYWWDKFNTEIYVNYEADYQLGDCPILFLNA